MAEVNKNEVQPVDEAPKLSQREQYDRDWAAMNSDVDMNDEEAVYGRRNQMMGELGKYRKSNENLKKAIGGDDSMFGEALLAASEAGEGFDLVKWLAEKKGADIKQALEDPEYSKSIVEAHEQALAKKAEDSKTMEDVKERGKAAFATIYEEDGKAGIKPEQTKQNLIKMFDFLDDAANGNYVQIYNLLSKGGRYDDAVAMAENKGRKEGMKTKVDDALRKLPQAPAKQARQEATPEQKPKSKYSNPFIDA